MEITELIQDEEDDIENIEKIYKDINEDPDKDISGTSKLIEKALMDKNIHKKMTKNMIDFDTSDDNLMHDEQLKNIYKKNYITSQYIFKDDTIQTIKSKICCTIKNNPKFGKNVYILPSRQYLYCEYLYQKEIVPIMVGQKWIHRSELLKIDAIPNKNIYIYEELRGNLKILRDNIKRYGSKIRKEDDDNNILEDYEGYYTNNELCLYDIYNVVGFGYNVDHYAFKNINDVYRAVYFPKIWADDLKNIINYLNNKNNLEDSKILSVYNSINNDMIVENEVVKTVEDVKKTNEYKTIFKENYIIQSVIHLNTKIQNGKIDLFRIFNEFQVNNKYPFLQYQSIEGKPVFKYDENSINRYKQDINMHPLLTKWFENAPYGISFKIRIEKEEKVKFTQVNLSSTGRIDYKTVWKEEEKSTIDEVKKTYIYIKDLLRVLNNDNNKVKFIIPDDSEFRFAFINSIQNYRIPDKFVVNHNHLSDFSRYFFPYVTLQTDPRKRKSKLKKNVEEGKFGTYLKYKRISKYEIKSRLEQRILYFMRNYEFDNDSLALEISKQFSILESVALFEIKRVREKYPNLKKSRKVLKKLENLPKYKAPGISVDIQGRYKDKYKIRISGARNKMQLDRIINFINILIWLYIETYLYKKPYRQEIKNKLKQLTHIAQRRNKVSTYVLYETEKKTVKQMTRLDQRRLGFKPDKGHNQWTRSCQNSGKNKRRQQQQHTDLRKILKLGYKLNKKTGMYEKDVYIKVKNKRKKITIRAVKMPILDDTGNPTGEYVYYTCNPNDNGQHTHIGFLTRSRNPFGECMPCCFINDQYTSTKKEKKDFFMSCINPDRKSIVQQKKTMGEQLYILQDTNKIQEGRLSFLPNQLDIFFNHSLGKTRIIKYHYLTKAKYGYYFKYGIRQTEYYFLHAISAILDISVDNIIKNIIKSLENDKGEKLFTSLNDGDIRTIFKSKEKYIKFIKTDKILDFDLLNNIISLPGILEKYGINIIVFKKQVHTIKNHELDKNQYKEVYTLLCQRSEESQDLLNKNRKTIFLIKENNKYYPIVMVTKLNETNKSITITKQFEYGNEKDNIIDHIYDYYKRNCISNFLGEGKTKKRTAKETYKILKNLSDTEFHPKYQIIDTRYKTKYIITKNLTIVPVIPSGSIYNLMIIKKIENQYIDLKTMLTNLKKLQSLVGSQLLVEPIGIYYDRIDKSKDKINVIGITTKVYDSIPIIHDTIKFSWILKQGLVMMDQPLFDKIDNELEKGTDNYVVDDRILEVNYNEYYTESYELFRLELSDFLDKNEHTKKKIIKLINSKNLEKDEKKKKIKQIIYKSIDKKLYELFNKQQGGSGFIHVTKQLPLLKTYKPSNIRDSCTIHKNKTSCDNSLHCKWHYDECYLSLTREMIIVFIDKVSEELVLNNNKTMEILKQDGYYVSDIRDYNHFTERKGQKIISSLNTRIKELLKDIFGTHSIPQIGRRKNIFIKKADEITLNLENPLKELKNNYIQNIITNNMDIYRAYANGFYWIKNYYYAPSSRNLGYYNDRQSKLSDYFRSQVLDWLLSNKDKINKNVLGYINSVSTDPIGKVISFIKYMSDQTQIHTLNNCIIELYVLSKIYYNINICVYDNHMKIRYIYSNGLIYNSNTNNKPNVNKLDNKNTIYLIFNYTRNNMIPSSIKVLYPKSTFTPNH